MTNRSKYYDMGYKFGRAVGHGLVIGTAAFATGLMSIGAGVGMALTVNKLTGFSVAPRPWKQALTIGGYFAGIGTGAVVGAKYLLMPAISSALDDDTF